jgi:rhodanese-related sulfurtransferase
MTSESEGGIIANGSGGDAPTWALNWASHLYRSEIGTPFLPVGFVAGQGPQVRLIDVRDPQDFIGPLGYIPGSDWIPFERIDSLPGRLGTGTPLVIVSRYGERASEVARLLEGSGMRYVAALGGGLAQWLSLGFSTTRDPAILDRCDDLRRIEPPTSAGSAHSGPYLSINEVEEHLGDPLSVRWIKMAALVLHSHVSCIDGRDDRGIVGTPGGDAGQFLLTLAAIESILDRPLEADAIAALLERRIDALGGFYMHTDSGALQRATDAMRLDPRLTAAVADFDEPSSWRQFLKRPPLMLRDAVLEHLCEPGAIGCGHIRLMNQLGGDYRVRPGLVSDYLRAFFHSRWEGAFRSEFERLDGSHGERAVLNTRIEGKLQPFSPIPLISPSSFGCQMFVNHPQVSHYLLQLLVDFLLLQSDLVPEFAKKDLRPILLMEVENLHAVHVQNSLSHLAKDLPVYDVVFDAAGKIRVEATGVVT